MPPTVGQLQTVSFFPSPLSQYFASTGVSWHWHSTGTHTLTTPLFTSGLSFFCTAAPRSHAKLLMLQDLSIILRACTPGTEVLIYISNKEFYASQGTYCVVTVLPSLIRVPAICVICKSAPALMLPSQSVISVEPLHQYLHLVSVPQLY